MIWFRCTTIICYKQISDSSTTALIFWKISYKQKYKLEHFRLFMQLLKIYIFQMSAIALQPQYGDSRKRSSLLFFLFAYNVIFKIWMPSCCCHYFVYETWKLPLSLETKLFANYFESETVKPCGLWVKLKLSNSIISLLIGEVFGLIERRIDQRLLFQGQTVAN